MVVAPSCEPRVLLEQDPAHKLYATGHHNIVNVPGTDEWVIAYRRFTYNPPISRVAGDADSVAQYVKRERTIHYSCVFCDSKCVLHM